MNNFFVIFGANWSRNNVWKQPNKKPDYDKHILAITIYGVFKGYPAEINPATIRPMALNNASTDTARLAATVVIPIMFCATADA